MSCKKLLISMFLLFTLIMNVHMAAETKAKKIGVLWISKSAMAEQVLKGFQTYLNNKAPHIAIECQKELADEAAALQILKRFQTEKDGIVVLRSSGVQLAVKNPTNKPVFIGACSNPLELKATKSLENPTGNITGVTYFIPAERQIKFLTKIFPNLKRVGLLTEDGHASTPIEIKQTGDACKSRGIEFFPISCKKPEEITNALSTLKEKNADIVILGNQQLLIDSAIIPPANFGNTPIISYSEKPIKKNYALCGLVADDEKLGKMLAESVMDILDMGKKINEVPIQVDPKPNFLLNIPMMKKLGITIPSDILSYAKKIE